MTFPDVDVVVDLGCKKSVVYDAQRHRKMLMEEVRVCEKACALDINVAAAKFECARSEASVLINARASLRSVSRFAPSNPARRSG